MKRLALVLAALVVLAGCTSTIHLRHPDGRAATCGGSASFGWAYTMTAAQRDRDCVADYQRQGYERVPG